MASCEPPSTNNLVITMAVESVLHMKEGLGEASYAQNSSLQKKTTDAMKHIIVQSAMQAYAYASKAQRSFTIADLGCSSGSNALSLVAEIVKSVDDVARRFARPVPEFVVFLNDLPTNDFNALFMSFPEFTKKIKEGVDPPSVCLAGVPGSFYGRLFPSSSITFIHSCYSLHWLSQVPPGLTDENGKPMNKGKMYISQSSPPAVASAYFVQFQRDFRLFLKCRSAELQFDGRMVIAMLGRRTQDHSDNTTTVLWQVLDQAFAIMVSQEMIEQEKVDAYNVPFYAPSAKEIEDEVSQEGSFEIDFIRTCELNTSTGDPTKDARITSMAIRAIQESMLSHHFGGEIIETLFQIYGELLSKLMVEEEIKSCHLLLALRKSRH